MRLSEGRARSAACREFRVDAVPRAVRRGGAKGEEAGSTAEKWKSEPTEKAETARDYFNFLGKERLRRTGKAQK